ncbi:hypothetical protein SAMN05720766_101105 [Fibrobacter sp. UWH9]|nr:LEPR-XLL domain-containing protein [Fibrobacter sp. UWH9]SHG29003.1 hypothetical protein SAMN05720766_101105 [Fibrobacter sp. UWH9]
MSKKQQKKKLNASNFKIEALEPRLMMDVNLSIKKSPSRV